MKATRPALHFFAGLTLGTVLFAAHLLYIGLHMSGKANATIAANVKLGLLWPLCFAFLGLYFAWNKPLIWKTSWLLAMALALTLLLALCACVFFFILIAFSGYC